MQRIDSTIAPIYYQFDMWRNAPFQHGVFTRHGGVSAAPYGTLNIGSTVGDDIQAVRQNHQRIYDVLNVKAENACSVWQVHGADTVIATAPPQGRKWINRADGLVTNLKGYPLLMRYADCVPILYFDPMHEVIGIAHAGWRGTLAGAQTSVIETMQSAFGSQPADIQVGIGPSIGPDNFQVGEEVVAAFQERFGDLDGLMKRSPDDGTAYINLWEANRRILAEAGVQHIEIAEICTYAATDDFFSHRAENGKTGRFGAVISL